MKIWVAVAIEHGSGPMYVAAGDTKAAAMAALTSDIAARADKSQSLEEIAEWISDYHRIELEEVELVQQYKTR